MNYGYSVIDALAKSKMFQEYQKAFTQATGLPLSLRSAESWQLPHHGIESENRFCAIMAQRSRSCAHCLQVQQKLRENAAGRQPCTMVCSAGLSETAVPVRVAEKPIGFLHTGQVLLTNPTAAGFERTARMVRGWGVEVDAAELRVAYFSTRVVPPMQYAAFVGLLSVFADHLSMVGNQLLVQKATNEPPAITRAKQFITEHHGEDVSLGQVAKAMNISLFYFCKMFKRVTGMKFTEYLSSVRIEKSKNLLLNRNLRVSEIGFEVGFQSLTHFNRVFKGMVGRSPTDYRHTLPTLTQPGGDFSATEKVWSTDQNSTRTL